MNERAIFEAALEIQDTERQRAYLDQACMDRPELRGRIEDLLKSHELAGSFLNLPVADQLEPKAALPLNRTTDLSLHANAEGERDDAPIDLGFLQPSKKAGSIGRLAHYEVLQVLGQGGFGIVLKAFDEKLQRLVAIKVMSPQMAATSPPRKRFLREARAAAAIKHENVVQVYTVDEQPLPYLVMEYVDGQTLQQKMDVAGPLEVPEVLHLARQIASGLAAAHAMGLIHRDIKPGNILLEQGVEQKVKITDFGLARAADDASMTRTGVVSGTPMYMAPEQALGQPLDQRADLFSFGSVLYQMVCGRPPFRASATVAVLHRVANDTPRPLQEVLPEIPEWLAAIVAKLHAKDPAGRFQSAKEVADLLAHSQRELEQEGHMVSPAPIVPASPRKVDVEKKPALQERPSSPRSFRWAAVAALLLVLLAGLSLTEATGVTNVSSTVIRLISPEGTLVLEVDDPSVSVSINGEELVITGAGVQEIRLKPGLHKLVASKDGRPVKQELVTVTRNGRQVVRVSKELQTAVAGAAQSAAAQLPTGAAPPAKDSFTGKLIFYDTFDDPNSTTVFQGERDGQNFVVNGGVYSMEVAKANTNDNFMFPAGVPTSSAPAPHEVAFATRMQADNVDIVVHFRTRFSGPEWRGHGLFVRITPSGRWLVIRSDKATVNGQRTDKLTVLAEATQDDPDLAAGKWVTVSGRAAGHEYEVWVNGKSVARGIDDPAFTGTSTSGSAIFYTGYVVANGPGRLSIDYTAVWELPGAPDRRAAEYVFSLGGIVRVNGEERDIKALSDLPKNAFRLTSFDLNDNKAVTDSGLINFQGCTNIAQIQLQNTAVSDLGLVNFKDCANLEFLGLDSTQVSDAGVAHFQGCKRLWSVCVAETGVTDTGLMRFKDCPSLRQFNLFGTRVSDAWTEQFQGRTDITYLGLGKTRVTDAGMANFKDCKNIQSLGLQETQVSDVGLAHFSGCNNLKQLILNGTAVSDTGLAHFQNCKELTDLRLYNTKISDDGLVHFQNCKHLAILDLNWTAVGDAGLAHFKDCKNLMFLGLNITRVTDAGMVNFSDCKDLEGVHLYDTRVGDTGLASFRGCKNLLTLELGKTQVTDTGLGHFKDSQNLTTLWLAHTSISDAGLVPFQKCKSLTSLRLQKTGISRACIEGFRALLPLCKIETDGGTVQGNRFLNTLGMKFSLVPKGRAWLGGTAGKLGETEVEFNNDFYLGTYEVTQEEWEGLMGKNPSAFGPQGNLKEDVKDIPAATLKKFPVDSVSWDDAQLFLKKLNEQSGETGWTYRLPLEAEWEYASRGGPMTEKAEGGFQFTLEKPTNQLRSTQANINNELKRTCQVGSYSPNPLGLFDMHGNVWEWSADDTGKEFRWVLGGCYAISADYASAANRGHNAPAIRLEHHGLRVARVPVSTNPDRRAAEYVLSLGGAITISENGIRKPLKAIWELPPGEFFLTDVDLEQNPRVTDEGLANFKGCRNLEFLSLFDTAVGDAGVAHFQQNKQLAVLHLGKTKVTDAGVAHFAVAKSLTYLNLDSTAVSDRGLAHFQGCKDLAQLVLNFTQVGDEGLSHFRNCTNLTHLILNSTQVSNAGLAHFTDCKKLKRLYLEGTHVTDEGLAHFRDCKDLQHLLLADTQIGDFGLTYFEDCKNLTLLHLQKTKVTQARIDGFHKAHPHCKIVCDGQTIEPK